MCAGTAIEQRGEDLRLAYVALTRAKHQAVIWWAGSYDSRNSPLGRLLFAMSPDGDVACDGSSTPGDSAADERFAELAAKAPDGAVGVERSSLGLPSMWSPPIEPAASLTAARFDRRLDLWWRRTSYSDITAEAHDPLVASEPEAPVLNDEPEMPAPVFAPVLVPGAGDADPGLERESPLGTAPVGVEFGTFVHTVLEATDFTAPDLDAELVGCVEAARSDGLSTSVTTIGSLPGCGPRSRRRSVRSSAGCACATSPEPTASTSSSSSCRSPAATLRPGG